MNVIKSILLWVAIVFIFVFACMTNIVGVIFGLIAIALILPIKKWQEMLAKFLKKSIKIIAIILAIILMIASISSVTEEPIGDVSSNTSSSVQVNNNSNISSIESSSDEEMPNESNTVTKEETSLDNDVSSASSEQQNTTSSKEDTGSTKTHIHTFVAATCILPEKCSCGEINGEAKGHSWNDATCTTPKTCIACQAKEGYALGHQYSNGSCTICGAQDPNHIPPQTNTTTYVLNIKSMKFHLISCKRLPEENREDTTKSREEIVNEGYEPCRLCNP